MPDGPLQSLINGRQAEHISIRDRGFQYGDGCFETIRVLFNNLILRVEHLARLRRACAALSLSVDFDLLETEIALLLRSNAEPDAILKITVTRGESDRGYSPIDTAQCTRVLQLKPYKSPDTATGAKIVFCQHRLSSNSSLVGIKHLNRLDQVLASAQIPAGQDEGLCMDETGNVIEGCRSNLLVVIDNHLVTPVLSHCGVEGVMLNHTISAFEAQGTPVTRERINVEQLKAAEDILLCNSVFGVWPVAEISGEDWKPDRNRCVYRVGALQIHSALFGSTSL